MLRENRMAQQAEKVSKPEGGRSKTRTDQNLIVGMGREPCTPGEEWLQLQRGLGNRKVQRLAQRHADRLHIRTLSGTVMPVQLLRSGRVGRIGYTEEAEDLVSIEMPYQTDSFETVLAGVNRVVQSAFGSRSRNYADDPAFQGALRAYLESIQHPSVFRGAPVPTSSALLRFQVRLNREGERIRGIELVTTQQRREPARQQPSSPAVEIPPTVPSAPGAAQAPAISTPANEPESLISGAANWVAGGLESVADLASARWLWNPINEGLQSWERELVDIGGSLRHQPESASVLIHPITVLYTLLGSIAGTLDLAARWLNPPNIALRVVATQIRVATGDISAAELAAQAFQLSDQVIDITSMGIRTAVRHLREGWNKGNAFRFTQGITELALAALALLGILRAIRAPARAPTAPVESPVRTPGVAEQVAGAVPSETVIAGEATPIPRPAEPAPTARPPSEVGIGEAATIQQPAAPAEAAAAHPPSSAGIGEAATVQQPAAPAEAAAAHPPRGPQAGEVGAAVRAAPPIFESWRVFEGGQAGAGNVRILQYTRNPAAARAIMNQIERGEIAGVTSELSLSDAMMQTEWRLYGGSGAMPPAWIEMRSGGTVVGRFSMPEVGYPEGFGGLGPETSARLRAVRRPPVEPGEPVPAEQPPRAPGASPLAVEVITDIDLARQRLAEFRAAGRMVRGRTGPALEAEWQRVQGVGEPPYAWVNQNGVLIFNIEITLR
jgi:hypothetical protein